ncbi:MAG TPA: efflux RND transporter periplasmic adaptor subunit [Bordetella sp.]
MSHRSSFFLPFSGRLEPGRAARRALLPGAAVLALALLAGCGDKTSNSEAAVPVIAQPVQAAGGVEASRFPGAVHARFEMPLSFRVAGQLTARYVEAGAAVKKGQPLAQLDPADAGSQQAAARAALDAAEHRLLYAAQQRGRDAAQARQNLISQLQLEQTQDAYAAALAARDQARQQYQLAQNQSRYTTLTADHDGVIAGLRAEVGEVLTAGQAVYDYAWDGEREVRIDVPESRIGGLALGQAATVRLPARPGREYAARVREIAAAADPQSRTYLVRLTLDPAGGDLPPLGMTADVALQGTAAAPGQVRIPATALFHQGEQPAVWVVGADNTLALRPVSVRRYGERDVLVASGLQAGERIVMQGVHTVSAGMKVELVNPPHPEDAPR